MKKATINIEVSGDSRHLAVNTEISGEIGALILGLTNAIKEVEKKVPEENRYDYRIKILDYLNDRY